MNTPTGTRFRVLAFASTVWASSLVACAGPATRADAADASDSFSLSDGSDTDDVLDAAAERDAADVVIGPPDVSDPRFASTVADLWQSMQSEHVPGAAIAIVMDGSLAYSTGLGIKRIYRTDPVDSHTLFRVGSLTKMITAATVMSLVEQGRIDLARPITDYATVFQLRPPFDPSRITTRHLLTHSSGIPDGAFGTCPVTPFALTEWFTTHTDMPLWSPPGAVWDYSNQGFIVAGLVAESASVTPFADLVQGRVLDPAGMADATFDSATAQTRDHATGHVIGADGTGGLTFEPISSDCGYGRPAGGLYASVVDYAHFMETMLAGGGVMLRSESVSAMMADQFPTHDNPDEHYGFGFNAYPYRGVRVVEHGGVTYGFQASLVMVPERRFGVVIFTNSTFYSPLGVALRAATRLLGLTGSLPSYGTDPATWGDYAGVYNDPVQFGQVTVELRGGALYARVGTRAEARLTQIAGDHFVIGSEANFVLSGLTFWRDAPGAAAYFVTREGVAARMP